MFFMIGMIQQRKEIPYDKMIICNKCMSYGRYTVYMTYMVLSLFFIPVLKFNKRYIVTTTCCSTSYELDKEIGKRLAKGEDLEILPEHLNRII